MTVGDSLLLAKRNLLKPLKEKVADQEVGQEISLQGILVPGKAGEEIHPETDNQGHREEAGAEVVAGAPREEILLLTNTKNYLILQGILDQAHLREIDQGTSQGMAQERVLEKGLDIGLVKVKSGQGNLGPGQKRDQGRTPQEILHQEIKAPS